MRYFFHQIRKCLERRCCVLVWWHFESTQWFIRNWFDKNSVSGRSHMIFPYNQSVLLAQLLTKQLDFVLVYTCHLKRIFNVILCYITWHFQNCESYYTILRNCLLRLSFICKLFVSLKFGGYKIEFTAYCQNFNCTLKQNRGENCYNLDMVKCWSIECYFPYRKKKSVIQKCNKSRLQPL